jgi:uncharacterized Zn-finger protein
VIEEGTECFKCNVCGLRFFFKERLKDHMNVHLGLRPYKCPLCDAAFSTGDTFRSHTRHVHKMNPTQCAVKAKEMGLGAGTEDASVEGDE